MAGRLCMGWGLVGAGVGEGRRLEEMLEMSWGVGSEDTLDLWETCVVWQADILI